MKIARDWKDSTGQRLKTQKNVKKVKNKIGVMKIDRLKMSVIMGELGNNKSPGMNGLRNELFKYGNDSYLVEYISDMLEKSINNGVILLKFDVGLIRTIIKNKEESNSDINNSRPITLSETLSAIFEEIVRQELKKVERHTQINLVSLNVASL